MGEVSSGSHVRPTMFLPENLLWILTSQLNHAFTPQVLLDEIKELHISKGGLQMQAEHKAVLWIEPQCQR